MLNSQPVVSVVRDTIKATNFNLETTKTNKHMRRDGEEEEREKEKEREQKKIPRRIVCLPTHADMKQNSLCIK